MRAGRPKLRPETEVLLMGRNRACLRSAFRTLVLATATALLVLGSVHPGLAQTGPGIFDFWSPFLTFQPLAGEIQIRPIYAWVTGGENSMSSLGLSWDLKEDFSLVAPKAYIDIMARAQVGRVSFRANLDILEFEGTLKFRKDPTRHSAAARFESTGFRFGAEVDLLQWDKSRFGLNADYYIYSPIFTEAIHTAGGKKIIGQSPVTVGIHGAFKPRISYYGMCASLEARARWPLTGAQVTEWEICAGVESAETFVGSIGLRGGYRSASMKFKDSQLYNGQEVSTSFRIVTEGVFAELVYTY